LLVTNNRLVAAGITHIVFNLPAPYPAGVAQWVADELIGGNA
jgi:hypothetical protein